MEKDKIRRQHGLTESEIGLLHVIKDKPEKVMLVHSKATQRGKTVSIEELRKKTLEGKIVIDKELTLFYTLNDDRTEPARRALYLMQEELMLEGILETPLSELNETI